MRLDPQEHKEALEECAALGLHPRICPNDIEDEHHSDFPINVEDRAFGSAIAYFVGRVDHLSGVETTDDGRDMSFHHLSSSDQWARIARALRVHGLKIDDVPSQPDPSS